MESGSNPIVWTPGEELQKQCNMTRLMAWLSKEKGLQFQDYHALHAWSVKEIAAFWQCLWEYFQIQSKTPYEQVLDSYRMPGVKWFSGSRLNYAEHVFRNGRAGDTAILFRNERGQSRDITWRSLAAAVARIQSLYASLGLQPGDVVCAYLPNIPEASVAMLAAASSGLIWSSCSPDFGVSSVIDRFAQVKPAVLIAVDGYSYNGKTFDRRKEVQEICNGIPSISRVILIPYLGLGTEGLHFDFLLWPANCEEGDEMPDFVPLPFEHPIYVLYSSGTTGIPKAITHGHGGMLLEHLKYLHLHNDVRTGERFFWYTTTGWMMWNFVHASLLAGASIVLYDGSPSYPDLEVLWKLAEETEIRHFGTSAPFLIACMKAGLKPREKFDLKRIRSIGSTGSPLPQEAFDWCYAQVNPEVWLCSMSGGTDVCTAFVGGNPLLPVYRGEIQCIGLGCDLVMFDDEGQQIINEREDEHHSGEMIVRSPMPCMPVFFWNDPDGTRYRESYFSEFPGVWRHGDLIEITSRGSVIIFGRSDATLNRQGIRIGTAEIYRTLNQIPEVADSLIISLEFRDGNGWMPLFVVLAPGCAASEDLYARIRRILREENSPRHVPDEILIVPDIPYTISGKKMELPVKKILMGKPLSAVVNPGSMRNPDSLAFYVSYGEMLRNRFPAL